MKKVWKVETRIRRRGQNHKTTVITHARYFTENEAINKLEEGKKDLKLKVKFLPLKKIIYDINQTITVEEIKELKDY